MSPENAYARALGFTVVALSVALEETLKALAEKHGKQPGHWLDELEDVAPFRTGSPCRAARGRGWRRLRRARSAKVLRERLEKQVVVDISAIRNKTPKRAAGLIWRISPPAVCQRIAAVRTLVGLDGFGRAG